MKLSRFPNSSTRYSSARACLQPKKAVKSEYDIGPEYFEVAEDAPYRDMSSLKAAAESVYSADYLKSVYIMAFEGYEEDNITPRYKEVNGVLFVDINWKALDLRTELDLSSAEVVESTPTKVRIKVNYTPPRYRRKRHPDIGYGKSGRSLAA